MQPHPPTTTTLCMELELSLGILSAPAKGGTIATVLSSTHTGSGECQELVLELGLGVQSARRAERDSQKEPMQQKEDHVGSSLFESRIVPSLSGPLLLKFPKTGKRGLYEQTSDIAYMVDWFQLPNLK